MTTNEEKYLVFLIARRLWEQEDAPIGEMVKDFIEHKRSVGKTKDITGVKVVIEG